MRYANIANNVVTAVTTANMGEEPDWLIDDDSWVECELWVNVGTQYIDGAFVPPEPEEGA